MTSEQIVRTWKDADYRASLSTSESSAVPANPVGSIDLTDDALGQVAGGDMYMNTEYLETLGCCKGITERGKCDLTVGYPFCTMECWTIILTIT